ncbi:MAG: GGDEF domain-containing protein [Parvularculaceae bacterium]
MKIGDGPKTVGGARIDRARATGAATASATSGAAAPSDQVILAGIPESEMSPRVREALMSLMKEVQNLRAELADTKKRMGELELLADRDPLIGIILNRRAFVRELDRALAMIDRYGMKASLVFVDLNDLKKINDGMGHGAGDAALVHIAETIAASIRNTDAVGRLGGDEFGVLLTQADQQTAEMKAAQLSNAVSSRQVAWKDNAFTAHVSCGVVEIHKGATADEAMERADSAMYDVKARKKGA